MLAEYRDRVNLLYKDMPLRSHPLAHQAHEAARCAGAAGKYWPYHDRLFDAQPAFERLDLLAYAEELGLDRAAFAACVDSHRFAAAVDADVAEARTLRVSGTPTFFIDGRALSGVLPLEVFRSAIEDALRNAR